MPQIKNKAPDWIRESNLIEDVNDRKEDARCARAWEWLADQKELNTDIILELHRRIMEKALPKWAGKWRKSRVWVGHREGAPWPEVPTLIFKWLALWTSRKFNNDAGKYIQTAHVDFERIHPFLDGNGRTGRMIMNWQRVRADLEPLCILAAERRTYYDWF